MSKILEIRNSTAEFLTFVASSKENGVQVVYQDESVWATQTAMAELFDVSTKTIAEHLTNIFNEGELQKDRTIRKFQIVQLEGTRSVNREPMLSSVSAIALTASARHSSVSGVPMSFGSSQYVDMSLTRSCGIYSKQTVFGDMDVVRDAVGALVDDYKTTLYTNVSRIKKKITDKLGRKAAPYIITRENGTYSIKVSRDLVSGM